MAIKPCECGSTNILDLTFVLCRDCRRRTRNYQMTTGEYQSEARAALYDWNNRRYETEEEKAKREKTEQLFADHNRKKAEKNS